MPSQPSDNEPVSVDDWYHTKNSAPTTTEVLLCTLLIQLVVGNGREGFMGAVEAEMAPNSVPQGGGGRCGGHEDSSHATKVSEPVPGYGAVQLKQGCRPGDHQGIGKLPRYWKTGRGVALVNIHTYQRPQGRQAAGSCPCWHKVERSKVSRRGDSTDHHDDESQR